jgi:lipid II:glycine glycyltransferase (peptidoglycan interpeptide bridge formation enzyme)
LAGIISALERERHDRKLRYIELRPRHPLESQLSTPHATHSYCLHEIDLRADLDQLFAHCHKDSTQRKIRRAEREGLEYEEGRSAVLFDNFYRLLVLTRRRHQLPPQPKRWFRNLIDSFGDALKIRVASKDKQPVAAILTLRHKTTMVYKYGCSDARFHNLGAMHLLLWRSISEAKLAGLLTFDLGRSDLSEPGLIRFKDRWGAQSFTIEYLRFSDSAGSQPEFAPAGTDWKQRLVRKIFPLLPDPVLCTASNLIWRHIG